MSIFVSFLIYKQRESNIYEKHKKTKQVVGKPSKKFFHLALSALEMEEADAGQVLMVGDDIRDDVLGRFQPKHPNTVYAYRGPGCWSSWSSSANRQIHRG